MIRSLVGRSAWIPFTLRRVPRTVMPEGRRAVKATLMVDYDTDEVLRFGYGPPDRALLRPAVRKELLELAAAEASFESVKDIQPQRQLTDAAAPALPEAAMPAESGSQERVVADRDQVVADALAEGERVENLPEDQLSEEELDTRLDQLSRDELKRLCGSTPGDQTSMGPFREWVTRAFDEFDTWSRIRAENPTLTLSRERPPSNYLTRRHQLWIRGQLMASAPEVLD
jgi:hypothetical protein